MAEEACFLVADVWQLLDMLEGDGCWGDTLVVVVMCVNQC
jgi:hypothetical protein